MTESREKEFISLIQQKLESDSLILPTLPKVANEVRDAFNHQPNLSAKELAAIISTDPALSVRLIHVANSALYSNGQQQKSIDKAVIKLGNLNTVQLVTSFAIKQTFTTSSTLLRHYLNNILQHTLSVSAISRGMALFAPNLNGEVAMLAGLVHQIGKLPVLKLYEDSKANFPVEQLDLILMKTHPLIGKIILQKWDFSDELVKVSSEYLNFEKNNESEVDYADIVTVAYLQACAGSSHVHANIDWSTVSAFTKLGLNLDSESLEFDDQVTQQIETTLAVLK